MKAVNWLALAACAWLAGCSPGTGEPETSSADRADALALSAQYEDARTSENWQHAEAVASQLRDRYPDSAEALQIESSLAGVRASAQAARDAQRLEELWEYQAVQAAGGVQRSAAIYSRTVVVEEGELRPTPDARLVLRDHPEWGRSAYLLLEQSKFACGSPCNLQLAFDDAPAQVFAGRQADSGKGPALFIKDEERFLAALSDARKLQLRLPKGSGRLGALVFEVAGFQPDRYERAELTRQP